MFSVMAMGNMLRKAIHMVTIINKENDDSLVLDLEKPEETGFAVLNISGLGPIKATINSTDLASGDGAVFSSSRVSTRNITMQLLLVPNDCTIEEQRIKAYRYFPVKKEVTLIFDMGTKSVAIDGYVEATEVSIFTSTESVNVSIICTNPYFVNIDDNCYAEFSSVEKGFEFPFNNDSISDGINKLIFGTIKDSNVGIVNYTGDADTGMIFTVYFNSKVEGLQIIANTYGSVLIFDDTIVKQVVDGGFSKGDELVLNTIRGQKSIYLYRGDYAYNLLNAVGKGVSFPQLRYGDNMFTVKATKGQSTINAVVEANIMYLGI